VLYNRRTRCADLYLDRRDEEDRVHSEDQPLNNSSLRVDGIVCGWGGKSLARKARSWRTCSAPPTGENIHRLGSVEGNSSDDALRIIEEGQGDGVKKLAGWATTAFSRLDRAQLDFHRGRRFDGNGGSGNQKRGEGTRGCEGGTLSISTATDQLSSS
jgi:hypothetical protein